MVKQKRRVTNVILYTGQVYTRNKQHVINKLAQRNIKRSNILGVKFGKKSTRFKAYVKGK